MTREEFIAENVKDGCNYTASEVRAMIQKAWILSRDEAIREIVKISLFTKEKKDDH